MMGKELRLPQNGKYKNKTPVPNNGYRKWRVDAQFLRFATRLSGPDSHRDVFPQDEK